LSIDPKTRECVPSGRSKLNELQLDTNSAVRQDSPVLLSCQSSRSVSDMNSSPSDRTDEQHRLDVFHNATVANAGGACKRRLQELEQEQDAKIRKHVQDCTTAVEISLRSCEQAVQRVQQEGEAKISKYVQEYETQLGQLMSIYHEHLGFLAEKYKITTQDDAGAHMRQSTTTTDTSYP